MLVARRAKTRERAAAPCAHLQGEFTSLPRPSVSKRPSPRPVPKLSPSGRPEVPTSEVDIEEATQVPPRNRQPRSRLHTTEPAHPCEHRPKNPALRQRLISEAEVVRPENNHYQVVIGVRRYGRTDLGSEVSGIRSAVYGGQGRHDGNGQTRGCGTRDGGGGRDLLGDPDGRPRRSMKPADGLWRMCWPYRVTRSSSYGVCRQRQSSPSSKGTTWGSYPTPETRSAARAPTPPCSMRGRSGATGWGRPTCRRPRPRGRDTIV